ncbi:MAG: SPOR domain-containing protein [Ignavibacteriaceae bacterium]
MKKGNILYIFPVLISVLLISCSASTSGRYGKEESNTEKKEENKGNTAKKEDNENFDLTPYRATFNVAGKENTIKTEKPDVWYNYKTRAASDTSAPQIVGQVSGFRVQVLSTDNLEEADSIRTELYVETNQKAVYITFEPPFYKVKVGDFLKVSEANDLKFKLNQIGYTEARVVNDKINIYNK